MSSFTFVCNNFKQCSVVKEKFHVQLHIWVQQLQTMFSDGREVSCPVSHLSATTSNNVQWRKRSSMSSFTFECNNFKQCSVTEDQRSSIPCGSFTTVSSVPWHDKRMHAVMDVISLTREEMRVVAEGLSARVSSIPFVTAAELTQQRTRPVNSSITAQIIMWPALTKGLQSRWDNWRKLPYRSFCQLIGVFTFSLDVASILSYSYIFSVHVDQL